MMQCYESCSYAESRQPDLEVKNLHFIQAEVVYTCILLIFLYGSECWAVTKRDVLKIDALDQWFVKAVTS